MYQLQIFSNGLDADSAKLFLPIVDKPHFEELNGIPIMQIRENTITELDLKGSEGKRLEAFGGIILAHVFTDNSSLQGLHVSSCSMGTAAAKAFGDMLSMNKTLKTLHVSDNSFGKMQVGDQVKIKSNGVMKIVTEIYSDGDIQFDGSSGWTHPSKVDWENLFPALCAGLKSNSTLEWLNVSQNRLGQAGGEALADALKANQNVRVLHVSSCSMGTAAAKA
jgi:hypothetical protein